MLKFKIINWIFVGVMILLIGLEFVSVHSLYAYAILVMVYLAMVTYGTVVLSAEFFVPVKYKGLVSSGTIAITFDDGPIPGKTEKILEVLKFHKVQAAFFCIGNQVANNSTLTKQIHNDGHLLGNHSYWHKSTFDLQSTKKIQDELSATDHAIHSAIGLKPTFFRPPYGVTNPMVASAIVKGNYKAIGWSIRSLDTISKDREALFGRITKSLKSGDIVLFHDYCTITLEILPDFITYVHNHGLKIVRVDQLLNEKAYV